MPVHLLKVAAGTGVADSLAAGSLGRYPERGLRGAPGTASPRSARPGVRIGVTRYPRREERGRSAASGSLGCGGGNTVAYRKTVRLFSRCDGGKRGP